MSTCLRLDEDILKENWQNVLANAKENITGEKQTQVYFILVVFQVMRRDDKSNSDIHLWDARWRYLVFPKLLLFTS